MNPKEFRIGNLVEYDNRVFRIDSIAESFPTLDTPEFGIGVVDWNNIKPIPLTEEWLIRFGFVKNGDLSKYWALNNVDVWELNGGYANDLDKTIESVHSLQNLYFCLIGKELILNESL